MAEDLLQCCIGNKIASSRVGEGRPGSSLALPVAVSISVFIAVLTVIVIMFILLRKKYSFKEGNLSIARKSYPTGSVGEGSIGEGEEGKTEEIEMEGPLVNVVVDDETCEEDGVPNQMQEETEDYFQDPTSILLPDIDPIPTERFPEYVRDMLYGEEHKLKAEFSALGKLPQPPSTVAVLPHNKAHNRFKNIYPYDRSRVCLKATPGVDSCDYINASFIDGYGGMKNAYIAAQGPVDVSVESFWRMVWEYETPTILMLTQCTEAGKVREMGWTLSLTSNKQHGMGAISTQGKSYCVDLVHTVFKYVNADTLVIQQQYEFIHCGLSELVVCGETEVAAANLRIALKNLKKKGPDGLTGFQRQMQIIEEVSSHHPVTFSDAEEEYNRIRTDSLTNYPMILIV
ncbi:Phosphatidylinositol phosphatase PTPRQ [Geodia barretti]|uniref:Phosphatidylinositol phosphatase PTPRQ n=1 Tax=Geodia barretti TaxID=519541 RepID=A0AA35SXW8_GEOBA|nr:Phosphatidylinositol phosphatase PTPRQ [Geodia barretti]